MYCIENNIQCTCDPNDSQTGQNAVDRGYSFDDGASLADCEEIQEKNDYRLIMDGLIPSDSDGNKSIVE